jgi:hypothetical protein
MFEVKLEKIKPYLGYQQINDIQDIDRELGCEPSTGRRCAKRWSYIKLARLLLENAQNQTGIELSDEEESKTLDYILKSVLHSYNG